MSIIDKIKDFTYINSHEWKKALRETQTLRAGCSKAEPKNFRPAADPLPGGAGRSKFNQLEMALPTNPVWWGSMHAISSYRGNRPTKLFNSLVMEGTALQAAQLVKWAVYIARQHVTHAERDIVLAIPSVRLSVRPMSVLCLNECTCRRTFWRSAKGISF